MRQESAASFKELVARLREKALAWTSGDLVLLSEIKEDLDAYLASADFAGLPFKARRSAKMVASCFSDPLDPAKEAFWKKAFLDWADNSLSVDLSDPALDGEEPEAAAAPASPDPRYGEDYFANIISDSKMLGQLCEEIKEHLDNAQFSLIDLEYDPSNAEHVNRIFRAFHTIKSSAAFLGFKNIEEVSHAMEDILVLVRDGKLSMGHELADVVFFGIGKLKDLEAIIESSEFAVPAMIESFSRVDIASYVAILKSIQAGYASKMIGEILIADGKLDRDTVDKILEHQRRSEKKFGQIALEEKLVPEADLQSALAKQQQQQQQEAAHRGKSSYVKVSNDRLNALIDIVGELVVNQSMLREILKGSNIGESGERTTAQLESITTTIKNLVLSMDMVPIAEIFNKLRVVVRNTAADTGKTVTVDFSGEDTELDRNVIENIYDPLVHIVRNAVDHGIEPPAEREAAGKPRMGRILISAEHKGSGIEVCVSDDGKGIDVRRVLEKALEKGLVAQEQVGALSTREIYSFLFLPGFSTAAKVSEISGRGVGLDVVRKNVEQIHGKVEILSEPGKGSRFVIRIPLTLAIIDGFVTEVDGSKYIFPFPLVEEILMPSAETLSKLDSGQCLVRNRGKYVPLVFAADIFGHTPVAAATGELGRLEGKVVVVLGYEGEHYGVVVDATSGKQEIVIKSLSEALARVKVFSGGTIFGDGSIGFVVDIEEFMSSARRAG